MLFDAQKAIALALSDRFLLQWEFFFDDTSAYHLDPHGAGRLIHTEKDSLERELALARCERFNGRHFYSLAQQFGVLDSYGSA